MLDQMPFQYANPKGRILNVISNGHRTSADDPMPVVDHPGLMQP
jgi:hypothetical protein